LSAIASGNVVYVTGLFNLGAVGTVVWTKLLNEPGLRQRLPATAFMAFGDLLIAA
jgi:hypothetical protein